MHPYTFNSNGTTARSLNPSSSDKSVVNSLYSGLLGSNTQSIDKEKSTDNTKLNNEIEDGIYLASSWAVYYENEKELEKVADLVVRAIVTKEGINKYSKGNPEMYITQSNLKVIGEHTTLLNQEDELVVFLREKEDGTYSPINEDDSIFIYNKENKEFQHIRSNKEFQSTKYKLKNEIRDF